MPLTLLQIVQRTQAELGLPQASTVVANTDATTQQMFALANRVIDELRRSNPIGWTAMQFEYNLVVPVPIITTGNLTTLYTTLITGIPSTAGILANYFTVSGASIPPAARVATVPDATSITMTMEAENSATTTGASLTFIQDTFPEPSGFDWFQNQTMWDRTNHWRLLGPDSPQVDQWHRSGIVATGPRRHFRQIGPYANNFRIWPPPADIAVPLQLVFEYASLNAVSVHGAATFAQYFANDDDKPLLDDQAIIMGIKWMFWEIKGMGSYVTLQSRWIDYVDRLIARDGAAPVLPLSRQLGSGLISPANVQDGSYIGPTGQPV
jgi:hypothetical protein